MWKEWMKGKGKEWMNGKESNKKEHTKKPLSYLFLNKFGRILAVRFDKVFVEIRGEKGY